MQTSLETLSIIVKNNDSDIIARDDLIIALCTEMMAINPVTIDLNREGPCAQSLGLYDILDKLCDKYSYTKSMVTIKTCNLIEQHADYNIEIVPQMDYLNVARHFAAGIIHQEKTFGDHFRHLGNFIGHGNLHRLHMASYLKKYHADRVYQSYHYRRGVEYHENFVGLEDMLFMDYSTVEIDTAYDFLQLCPITLDQIDGYPILSPHTFNITKIYHNFFVEIVNLTYFSGNTFYIDEKIWRPIITRTPFMVQGPQNFLDNFHRLGFQTFSHWWDEGYSEDPGRCQIDEIIANIKLLSEFSMDELRTIYAEMQPILDHNYQRLLSLTCRDFEIFQKK